MKHAILAVVMATWVASLSGCGAVLYYMIPEPPQKNVPAEYPHLPGHRLIIVVWTDMSTDCADPDFAMDLSRYVQETLKAKVDDLRFVSLSRVADYQQKNPRWADTPEPELGRKFDGDMLLYIRVGHYSATREGQLFQQQGKLVCSASLFDLSRPHGQEKVWDKGDLTVQWPPKEYGQGVSTNARKTRQKIMELYADVQAKCFYKHKEPINDQE